MIIDNEDIIQRLVKTLKHQKKTSLQLKVSSLSTDRVVSVMSVSSQMSMKCSCGKYQQSDLEIVNNMKSVGYMSLKRISNMYYPSGPRSQHNNTGSIWTAITVSNNKKITVRIKVINKLKHNKASKTRVGESVNVNVSCHHKAQQIQHKHILLESSILKSLSLDKKCNKSIVKFHAFFERFVLFKSKVT